MARRPGLRSSLRRAEFLRATRLGQRISTTHFLLFVLDRKEPGAARLGITVTRKVGPAVRRNRIKRLVREWFRQRGEGFENCDVVVIAKQGTPEGLHQQDVSCDLERGASGYRSREPG